MASLAACNWHKPLCVVPCLSWSTASNVFTNGVMSQSINWDVLETQYYSDGNYRERLAKMVTIVDDAFLAGQRFAQHFNKSINAIKDDIQNTRITDDQENKEEIVNVMGINRTTNPLNISPSLLEKLLSKEKCTLTKQEINELNEKIREAQNKWRTKIQPKKETVEIDALQVLQMANGIIPDKISGADSIASIIFGSTTKLMNYILPTKSKTAAVASNTPEESKAEPKEWWERESLQFMRGNAFELYLNRLLPHLIALYCRCNGRVHSPEELQCSR